MQFLTYVDDFSSQKWIPWLQKPQFKKKDHLSSIHSKRFRNISIFGGHLGGHLGFDATGQNF